LRPAIFRAWAALLDLRLLPCFFEQVVCSEHFELAGDFAHILPAGQGIEIQRPAGWCWRRRLIPGRLRGRRPGDAGLRFHGLQQRHAVDRVAQALAHLLRLHSGFCGPGLSTAREIARGQQPIGNDAEGIRVPDAP